MAQIKALRGVHYNLTRVGLDEVTTPPYDVIGPEAQDSYYRRSPFNMIRLDLGRTSETDTDENNRYTRAAADFADWQNQGILVRDERPALYVYRQTYDAGGGRRTVTGVICLVKLEEFGEGVLPHEKTLAAPKEDRRRLLEACRANFSQVFAVYSDESGRVKGSLEKAVVGPPEQTTVDEAGVTHSLWPMTDDSQIEIIADTLRTKRLLIADGHHRYETSLNFAKAARARGETAESLDYIMMYLVDMANETLTILPTHRLVTLDDFDLDEFIAKVRPTFEVIEGAGASIRSDGNGGPDKVTFGLYAPGRRLLLQADREALIDTVAAPQTTQWKRLDTALLQETLFGPILGISSGDPRLKFTQDPLEAERLVDVGAASLAVILEATDIEQIAAVAETGEKMPQKSTYFYPKPRTGLIINKLD